ncbi:DUF932 domain-containing protein [Streptomyces sp. NPDC102360]|uniref:DUF932 domain-containing protein n=1 Tax=Streptomyces sp. NPDC102360 TaxID=3366160 RepID=UPI00382E1A58
MIGRDGLDTTLGAAALYASIPAWHGLGNVIPGGISDIDTVLGLAGIDFQVHRVPAFYLWNGELRQHHGKYHTVRGDTGAALGVVGSQYAPIQNRSGFEFLQELVNDFGVIWESAGALREGRKVFISIRLPRTITIDAEGINDEIVPFVAVINSHDGRSPFTAVVTPWRPVCGNTERFAVRDAYTRWTVRHTKSATDRIKEARRTLSLSVNYYDKWASEETALARTDFAIDEFDRLIGELWPRSDDATARTARADDRRRDTLADMFTVQAQEIGRTAYTAERVITDYLDHVAPPRQDHDARDRPSDGIAHGHRRRDQIPCPPAAHAPSDCLSRPTGRAPSVRIPPPGRGPHPFRQQRRPIMCFELEIEAGGACSAPREMTCVRMATVLQVMNAFGMIEHREPPDGPTPEDFGTTYARIEAFLMSDAEEVPSDLVPYAAAMDKIFNAQADTPAGIPCFKVAHGGWLVTPDEISAALGSWDASIPEAQRMVRDGLSWWTEWIVFLETARDHGGFRVF